MPEKPEMMVTASVERKPAKRRKSCGSAKSKNEGSLNIRVGSSTQPSSAVTATSDLEFTVCSSTRHLGDVDRENSAPEQANDQIGTQSPPGSLTKDSGHMTRELLRSSEMSGCLATGAEARNRSGTNRRSNSSDGEVRAATIRTVESVYKRPVVEMAPVFFDLCFDESKLNKNLHMATVQHLFCP